MSKYYYTIFHDERRKGKSYEQASECPKLIEKINTFKDRRIFF